MDGVPASWTIDWTLLVAFAWFAWIGSVTPGPNCALALATGANFGLTSVRGHLVGVLIGFSSMLAAASAGAQTLFAQVPLAAVVLKWFGIGYLVWMGISLARARGLANRHAARPPRVHESALLQLANGKAWMLLTATVGAYQGLASPAWLEASLLIAVFAVCCALALVIWAWAGAALRGWLSDGTRLAWFNGLLGASLIATAVWMALQ